MKIKCITSRLVLSLVCLLASVSNWAQPNHSNCKDIISKRLGNLLTESTALYSSFAYQLVTPAKFTKGSQQGLMKEGKVQKAIGKAYENGDYVNTDRLYIEGLVDEYGLSRYQAIELQAVLRRYNTRPSDEVFLKALKAVRQGQGLASLNRNALDQADFVIALDLDGTMFDQHSNNKWSEEFHQFSYIYEGYKQKYVATTPGWYQFVAGIKELGGAVIIYSRNNDDVVHNLASVIKHEDQALIEMVDGVFSSGHMVMFPDQAEFMGDKSMSRLVLKDLSMFDLQKTIIIDDEVKYIRQHSHTRVVGEFSVDSLIPPPNYLSSIPAYTEAEEDFWLDQTGDYTELTLPKSEKYDPSDDIQHYRDQFSSILFEIRESLEYSKAHDISFTQAYSIYSSSGQDVIQTIIGESTKWLNPLKRNLSLKTAQLLLRSDPDMIDKVIKIREKRPTPPSTPQTHIKASKG